MWRLWDLVHGLQRIEWATHAGRACHSCGHVHEGCFGSSGVQALVYNELSDLQYQHDGFARRQRHPLRLRRPSDYSSYVYKDPPHIFVKSYRHCVSPILPPLWSLDNESDGLPILILARHDERGLPFKYDAFMIACYQPRS